MAWTYDLTKLAEKGKDTVRFLVGDTQSDEPLVQDEEILFALTENPNVYAAAAIVAESLAAFFATQPESVKIGPISEQANYRAKNYADLAKRLSIKANSKQSFNVVGSIETTTAEFSKGMHDHIGYVE